MPHDAVRVDNREQVVVVEAVRLSRTQSASCDVWAVIPVHAVLAEDAVVGIEFVGDKPVTQGCVIGVDLVDHVEQVGVIPLRWDTGYLSHKTSGMQK